MKRQVALPFARRRDLRAEDHAADVCVYDVFGIGFAGFPGVQMDMPSKRTSAVREWLLV